MFVCLLISALFLGANDTYAGDTISAAGRITLSKKKLILRIGDTAKLKVKNAKKRIKWTSKNVKIAKISKKGIVKGLNGGKTQIIAKMGKRKLVCRVTVKEKIAKIVYNNEVFDKGTYKNIKCQ